MPRATNVSRLYSNYNKQVNYRLLLLVSGTDVRSYQEIIGTGGLLRVA